MLESTRRRHELIRKRIKERVEILKRADVSDFVKVACQELENETGYTKRSLEDLYYSADT